MRLLVLELPALRVAGLRCVSGGAGQALDGLGKLTLVRVITSTAFALPVPHVEGLLNISDGIRSDPEVVAGRDFVVREIARFQVSAEGLVEVAHGGRGGAKVFELLVDKIKFGVAEVVGDRTRELNARMVRVQGLQVTSFSV